MSFTAQEHRAMARALQLAERGRYTARPNPQVGCVIVKDGLIVGEGWHQRYGKAHAEVNALAKAGDRARGATAFVTLEPCSFIGKTPPCSQALIAAGVSRVVCAMTDPNPKVSGTGMAQLRDAGIEVTSGLLESQARELNQGFCRRMRTGLPLVRCKLAMSLDGRTAMASGQSKWITGSAARADVQKLRARHDAIITGSGTVIADDPQLNVRTDQVTDWGDHTELSAIAQPLTVVLDRRARVVADARVFGAEKALWITQVAPSRSPANVECLQLAGADSDFIPQVLAELGKRGCNEVLLEAGHQLAGQFLAQGLLDQIIVYVAPKLMGDSGMGLFHLPELKNIADSIGLKIADVRQCGADLRLTLSVARQGDE